MEQTVTKAKENTGLGAFKPYPAGTRIRKKWSTIGDTHARHEQGIVISSESSKSPPRLTDIFITDPPVGMTEFRALFTYKVRFDGDTEIVTMPDYQIGKVNNETITKSKRKGKGQVNRAWTRNI